MKHHYEKFLLNRLDTEENLLTVNEFDENNTINRKEAEPAGMEIKARKARRVDNIDAELLRWIGNIGIDWV